MHTTLPSILVALLVLLTLPSDASAVEWEYECLYEGIVEGEDPLRLRVAKVGSTHDSSKCARVGESVTVGRGSSYDFGTTPAHIGDTVQLRWYCRTSSWVADRELWSVTCVRKPGGSLPIWLLATGVFAALARSVRRNGRRLVATE